MQTCSSVASSQPYAMLSRMVPCKRASQLYDDSSFEPCKPILPHMWQKHVRSGMTWQRDSAADQAITLLGSF